MSVAASYSQSLEPQRRRWWLVGFLTLLFVLSFIDRNVIRVLIDPIRADLGIDDVQISLLVGLAFSALYSLACLPFGAAADRVNRRGLLVIAVFCWSLMSMLCGVASSYGMLFAGRMGLGIGEAALQPSAMSMIRDSFPPHQRARPFSIYTSGPLIGSSMAMLVGGALYRFAEQGGTRSLPLLQHLHAWQFVLLIPGLLGLFVAALGFTVSEPSRTDGSAAKGGGFRDTFRHMRGHGHTYTLTIAMSTLWTLGNTGWSAWLVAAIGRSRGLSPGVVGPTAGVIALVCASIGTIGLGFYLDHRAGRGDRGALLRVSALVQCLHLIPAIAMFYVPTVTLMWVCYGLAMLLIGSTPIATFAILTELTPGPLMGKTIALYNLIQNFLGLAVGPTVFALVAAAFFQGPNGIIPATAICYALALLTSSVLALLLLRALRRAEPRPEGRAQIAA